MDRTKAMAAVGLAALAVAAVAFGGTLLAVGPARPVARELVMVAYVTFFLGVVGLLGSGLVTGLLPVGRWLRRRSGRS